MFWQFFCKYKIALWLRENAGCGNFCNFITYIFNVVAVEITNCLYSGNSQKSIDFRKITASLVFESRASLYI